MRRWDSYILGIIIGLIAPALFMLIYIDRFNMWSSLRLLGWQLAPSIGKLLMLSVFPNMALIFLFYSLDAWRLSKGVLIGAFPYLLAAIWATF